MSSGTETYWICTPLERGDHLQIWLIYTRLRHFWNIRALEWLALRIPVWIVTVHSLESWVMDLENGELQIRWFIVIFPKNDHTWWLFLPLVSLAPLRAAWALEIARSPRSLVGATSFNGRILEKSKRNNQDNPPKIGLSSMSFSRYATQNTDTVLCAYVCEKDMFTPSFHRWTVTRTQSPAELKRLNQDMMMPLSGSKVVATANSMYIYTYMCMYCIYILLLSIHIYIIIYTHIIYPYIYIIYITSSNCVFGLQITYAVYYTILYLIFI